MYDSEENINLLKTQIDISNNNAKKLLIKNKGDIVQCVLDNYEYKEKEISNYSNLDEDHPSRKCYELRQILDEKDKLFKKILNN